MQTIQDFAGSTNMWSTSVGGQLMKVVNLTGFTVQGIYVKVKYIFSLHVNCNISLKIYAKIEVLCVLDATGSLDISRVLTKLKCDFLL